MESDRRTLKISKEIITGGGYFSITCEENLSKEEEYLINNLISKTIDEAEKIIDS